MKNIFDTFISMPFGKLAILDHKIAKIVKNDENWLILMITCRIMLTAARKFRAIGSLLRNISTGVILAPSPQIKDVSKNMSSITKNPLL